MLKQCPYTCHALLSITECTASLEVVEQTQYNGLVCNMCINVIHGVPWSQTNEPGSQNLHPEQERQMFKKTLVSRIEDGMHHPSADETETIAKVPHPRASY